MFLIKSCNAYYTTSSLCISACEYGDEGLSGGETVPPCRKSRSHRSRGCSTTLPDVPEVMSGFTHNKESPQFVIVLKVNVRKVAYLPVRAPQLHTIVFTFTTITTLNHLLSAYDVISRNVIAVMQWPLCLITSCCSSVLTHNL